MINIVQIASDIFRGKWNSNVYFKDIFNVSSQEICNDGVPA